MVYFQTLIDTNYTQKYNAEEIIFKLHLDITVTDYFSD